MCFRVITVEVVRDGKFEEGVADGLESLQVDTCTSFIPHKISLTQSFMLRLYYLQIKQNLEREKERDIKKIKIKKCEKVRDKEDRDSWKKRNISYHFIERGREIESKREKKEKGEKIMP